MNKICTSIEQSKKLIELGIDTSSADMCYDLGGGEEKAHLECDNFITYFTNDEYPEGVDRYIPAWSLAALLSLIKDKYGYFELVYLQHTFDSSINPLDNVCRLSTDVYDIYNKEAVDACYEMIIKLHKLNN